MESQAHIASLADGRALNMTRAAVRKAGSDRSLSAAGSRLPYSSHYPVVVGSHDGNASDGD